MSCVYCDRTCSACGYPIEGGWEHVQQPQAPESLHVVCELKPVVRPLGQALSAYFDHAAHRKLKVIK